MIHEIGAGPGGILAYFRDRGHEVEGCDLGVESVEYARERGLKLKQGSIREVEFDRSPDVVVLSHVVEHFVDPLSERRAVRELVTERTLVYVEVPGIMTLRRSYRQDFKRMLQNAHTFYFTLTSLTNLMERAGFSFVTGTEHVRSIWTPSTSGSGTVVSDFDEVTRFLDRMETYRHLPTTSDLVWTIDHEIAPRVRPILRRAGVFDPVRSVYQRVMK